MATMTTGGKFVLLKRILREWPFVALVIVLLVMGTIWTQQTKLVPDRVRSIVVERLERDVRLETVEITILSILSKSEGSRVASVRLQGELLDLHFEKSSGEWSWEEVVKMDADVAESVDDYVGRLRVRNEKGALDILQLINTAEVAARARTGKHQPLSEMFAMGMLVVDFSRETPSGYSIALDVSDDSYRAFLTPTDYPRSGIRSFYSDDSFVLRGQDHNGRVAGPGDPLIDPEVPE